MCSTMLKLLQNMFKWVQMFQMGSDMPSRAWSSSSTLTFLAVLWSTILKKWLDSMIFQIFHQTLKNCEFCLALVSYFQSVVKMSPSFVIWILVALLLFTPSKRHKKVSFCTGSVCTSVRWPHASEPVANMLHCMLQCIFLSFCIWWYILMYNTHFHYIDSLND